MLSLSRTGSLQEFTDAKMRNSSFEVQSGRLVQLLFALSSLFLSKAQDVIGSAPSCLTSSPTGDGLTRVTFLREDAAGVLSLFLTLWSGDLRLVTCEVHADPVVTERHRALCDGKDTRGREISQRFNISSLLAADAPCALRSSSAQKFAVRTRGDGTQGKVRGKRSWIFPGTLWCGTGSLASNYEQLGMFVKADRCCREHDHCLHIIPALTKSYGVFNNRYHTVSHCDCDLRFRQCLRGANDTIANMVGYSFFSALKVPCFELKQQRRCKRIRNGRCRAVKQAPVAILISPVPYGSPVNTSKHGHNADSNKLKPTEEQHVTESARNNSDTNSTKGERRCSKHQFRGDTFHLKGEKGNRCKRQRKVHTEAPSQVPSISQEQNTTSSMNTSLLLSTVKPNTTRAEKKNTTTRKGLSTYTTQAPRQETTISYPQETSPTLRLHSPTASTAVTKTTRSHTEVSKESNCCGFRTTPRGRTHQRHCKGCADQKMTPHTSTVRPSATTHGSPTRATTSETPRLKQTTTRASKQDAWSSTTPATTIRAKLTTAASIYKDGKRQQTDSHPPGNDATQRPVRRTQAPKTHAERGLKLNLLLHNLTDNQLLCRSLKHLDECKYKIAPLESKYHLQNMDSKTAFHCDCTSRLAVQIESSNQPSVLHQLLMDFLSQNCFRLPKERKCDISKSCSGGFTKASDLLQALKKIEKDTAGVQNSGKDRKRGIPVRFYKRCLRLQGKADVMAQLTRL